MKNGCFKKIGTSFLLAPALLLTTLPAAAQYNGNNGYNRNGQYQQQQRNSGYYNGMRDGGRGGNYDRNDREQYRGNGYDGYYRKDNGIGPGKGAAIGAAGGAVLGALFGGGMKGAVIGGAAGAGVGAIAGKSAQDNRRRDEY
jgi:hypothetical protein